MEIATPGGIVFEVEVPLTVSVRLPEIGSEVELRTLQIQREDASVLYGFLEPLERALFVMLLSVSKVGGKLALKILSTYPGHRLGRALVEKDVAALVQVSGVGKKLAERLVLELADSVGDVLGAFGAPPTGEEAEVAAPAQAAVQALVALGMPFAAADAAVRRVLDGDESRSTEELVRLALASR